jgi:hypothetical protein
MSPKGDHQDGQGFFRPQGQEKPESLAIHFVLSTNMGNTNASYLAVEAVILCSGVARNSVS